jgi:tetratricopeptide (TPR) repeat protein
VLGNCYDRLGQDARAEACYGTCVALMPDFPWAHFNRGLALLRQHEHEQALLHFDEALRLKPHLTEALVNRALARQGLGHYSEAIADLTRALDLGAPETRLYFLRARLREKVKDVDGARRDYEEGLRREPADEKSWIARGLARLNREPQAALADFTQALKINPRSVAALQNSAHVLAEKLNQPEAALAMMEKAVACAPESGSARSGRGVLLARLGRRDAACRDAEDALLRDASPARRYQVACIYALTSVQEADDRPRALQLLAAAVRQGYGLDLLERDHDLDPLRTLPEFHRLVEAARALRANPAP